MIIVRYLSGVVVWSAIFVTFSCEIILCAFFYNKSLNASNGDYTDYNSKEGGLIISIIFLVLTILMFIFICCMYKKIRIAIAIVKVQFILFLIINKFKRHHLFLLLMLNPFIWSQLYNLLYYWHIMPCGLLVLLEFILWEILPQVQI